jgi:osmotically-inducible protein OsmY
MINTRSFLKTTFAGLLALSIVGCAGTSTTSSAGEYIDDSVISNTVRSQVIADKDLKLTQIDVETFKGVVQLSGFVDTQAAKSRAGWVAGGVNGVKQVHNNLIVK